MMDKDSLRTFVEGNTSLVLQKSIGDGLYILKYKKKVFYDNLWNDYLEHCRGIIVDDDFNIVQYPFTKIYNYGVESKAPKLDESTRVTAYRKVNGFMAAVTWHDGDVLISTTGSTDSAYVDYVREMIGDGIDNYRMVCEENSEYTYMFECCHPSDPHIVPEENGMYLLGVRKKEYCSKIELGDWMIGAAFLLNCKVPESYDVTLKELIDMSKTCKHEGFVFYTEDGVSAKIKSPYYLIKKFVARNPRTDKLMRSDIKNAMDEEYYPLIDAIQLNIEAYTSLDEQARLQWVRDFLENK
jgi:hypothetical protein